jgi:hypothetical protein
MTRDEFAQLFAERHLIVVEGDELALTFPSLGAIVFCRVGTRTLIEIIPISGDGAEDRHERLERILRGAGFAREIAEAHARAEVAS